MKQYTGNTKSFAIKVGMISIEKLAQDDRDKAMALQEFFSSVYTREPDNDFDKLPRRVPRNV